jgi:hypothetical protein
MSSAFCPCGRPTPCVSKTLARRPYDVKKAGLVTRSLKDSHCAIHWHPKPLVHNRYENTPCVLCLISVEIRSYDAEPFA